MSGEITLSQVGDETRVVWKIDNFLKMQDAKITSDSFRHERYELELRIYPNNDTWFEALTPPVLSMSLMVIDFDHCEFDEDYYDYNNERMYYPSYNIEYVMGMIKADSFEFRNKKYTSILKAGEKSTPAHELISRHNLVLNKRDMVPQGTLTVFCNIRHEKEKRAVNAASLTPSTYDGVSTLIENFKDMYLNQRYTDVKIKVQNKEFLAHKVILCARSEVFAAMLQHDTAEIRSGVVTIKDSDPESFECFLLYLYTGKLENVTSVNAASLYKLADKYGLKELKKECVEYMIKEMSVDSFCDIFHLAIMHNESDLLSSATNFFLFNANVILTSKEWLILLEKHASLCNELLVKVAKNGT